VFGFGCPAWREGPMHCGQQPKLKEIFLVRTPMVSKTERAIATLAEMPPEDIIILSQLPQRKA